MKLLTILLSLVCFTTIGQTLNYTSPVDLAVRNPIFAGSPLDISVESNEAYGIAFNRDGTKLFILDRIDDDINQYSLANP